MCGSITPIMEMITNNTTVYVFIVFCNLILLLKKIFTNSKSMGTIRKYADIEASKRKPWINENSFSFLEVNVILSEW